MPNFLTTVLLQGGQLATPQTLTDGATISWNVANGAMGIVTLGGNRSLANPTSLIAGRGYALKVIQDATGGRTLTYGTTYKIAGTIDTTANAVSWLSGYYDGTNLWLAVSKGFV